MDDGFGINRFTQRIPTMESNHNNERQNISIPMTSLKECLRSHDGDTKHNFIRNAKMNNQCLQSAMNINW